VIRARFLDSAETQSSHFASHRNLLEMIDERLFIYIGEYLCESLKDRKIPGLGEMVKEVGSNIAGKQNGDGGESNPMEVEEMVTEKVAGDEKGDGGAGDKSKNGTEENAENADEKVDGEKDEVNAGDMSTNSMEVDDIDFVWNDRGLKKESDDETRETGETGPSEGKDEGQKPGGAQPLISDSLAEALCGKGEFFGQNGKGVKPVIPPSSVKSETENEAGTTSDANSFTGGAAAAEGVKQEDGGKKDEEKEEIDNGEKEDANDSSDTNSSNKNDASQTFATAAESGTNAIILPHVNKIDPEVSAESPDASAEAPEASTTAPPESSAASTPPPKTSSSSPSTPSKTPPPKTSSPKTPPPKSPPKKPLLTLAAKKRLLHRKMQCSKMRFKSFMKGESTSLGAAKKERKDSYFQIGLKCVNVSG
jgi:hypothetical protein